MTTANISGAVIVVTGAGSGIGRASALMLAERGATVVAVDRDGEAIDKVTATTGGLAIAVDIRDPQHGDAVIARVLERYQRVDAVVANAGVGYVGDFATMPPENITSLVEVNFRGPLLLTRPRCLSMTERGSGALVFTTSIAGGVPVPTEAAICLEVSARDVRRCAARGAATDRRDRDDGPARSGADRVPRRPQQALRAEDPAAGRARGDRRGDHRRDRDREVSGAPFLAGSRSRSPPAPDAACLRGHVPPLRRQLTGDAGEDAAVRSHLKAQSFLAPKDAAVVARTRLASGVTKARSVPVIRSAQRRIRGGVSDIANSIAPNRPGTGTRNLPLLTAATIALATSAGSTVATGCIHFGEDAPADSSVRTTPGRTTVTATP